MSERVTVTPEEAGTRADVYLSASFGLTRTAAARLLEEGAATVDGKTVPKNYKLRAGEMLTLVMPPVRETETVAQDIPLSIVYEDEDIAVIDKPKGMVVHPAVGNED